MLSSRMLSPVPYPLPSVDGPAVPSSFQLTAKMRDGVERILAETATSGSTAASVARLKMEMERMEWRHRADLAEQKRTLGGWTR